MKIFSTTFIIVITMFSANAQAKKEIYLTQPDLKRFTGEWQYISHDTTFLIKLRLVKTFVNNDPLYIDAIQGDYIIKKGEQILQSSSNGEGISSGGYVDKNVSKNKIHFLFYDLGKKRKSGDAVFELLNGNNNQANWKLTNTEGVRFTLEGQKKYDYTFSVPTKAVFRKID